MYRSRRRHNLAMPQLLPVPDEVINRNREDREHERPIYSSPSLRPSAPRAAQIAVLSPIPSIDATHFIFNMEAQDSDRTLHSETDSLVSMNSSPVPLVNDDMYWMTPLSSPGSWSPQSQVSPPPTLTPPSPGSFYSTSPVMARLFQFPEYASQEAVNELSDQVDTAPVEHDAVLAFDARIPSDQIPLQVSAALGAMTRAVDWVIVAVPSKPADAHEAVDTMIHLHQLPPAKLIVIWDDLGLTALDLVHRYGLGGVFAQSAAALADTTRRIRKCYRHLSPSILSQRIRLRRICARSGDVPEAAYHVYAAADHSGDTHPERTAGHALCHRDRPRSTHDSVSQHHGKMGLQLLRSLHTHPAHGWRG